MKIATFRSNYRKKVSFDGIPKYNPINRDIVSLRYSVYIENMKKKLLDVTLNHIKFIHTNKASEEGMDSIKETFSIKKATKSS